MLSLNTKRPSSRRPLPGERVARRGRNIFISVFVLLFLFVCAGIAYTWYVGKNTTFKEEEIAAPIEKVIDPVMTTKKMAPDAVVSASVQMITSPLEPGSNAMVNVKTNPEAKCKITVVYDKTASTDSGLSEKVADEYGVVSWTWTIEPTAPFGSWPVTVTCANEKKSAVVVADLKLEKKKPAEVTPGN